MQKMKREKWSYCSVDVFISDLQGKVLLEKRTSGKYAGFWCLPGGHMDAGETFEGAAKREVFEETGYRIKVNCIVRAVSGKRYPGVDSVTVLLLGKIVGGKPRLQKGETTDLCFFGKDKLPKRIAFDHRKLISEGFRVIEKG